MVILNQQIENVSVGSLRAHPRNPNRGDVEAIVESIRAHGFYGTLVVQRSTGYILAGNHRLEAARRVGAEFVPVIWVDVTEDEALRILLADNAIAGEAIVDDRALLAILSEIGVAGTGFTPPDLARLMARLEPTPVLPPAQAADAEAQPMYCCPRCLYEWSGAPRPTDA